MVIIFCVYIVIAYCFIRHKNSFCFALSGIKTVSPLRKFGKYLYLHTHLHNNKNVYFYNTFIDSVFFSNGYSGEYPVSEIKIIAKLNSS